MNFFSKEILNLISPLFHHSGHELIPATDSQLVIFEDEASKNNVPEEAINQLKRLYKITNGINPSLDGLSIYKADDPLIYEFWKKQKRLWIGQRDLDTISWQEGKFHLGSAGNLNYGKGYIFNDMLELLIKGFQDWYPETGGKYPYK